MQKLLILSNYVFFGSVYAPLASKRIYSRKKKKEKEEDVDSNQF